MSEWSNRKVIHAAQRFLTTDPQSDRPFEGRTLREGDGGGTSGGMEERVARLEKHMDQLTKDVGDLRVSVATVTENVRHLPTKPWLFTTLAMMMTALAAIVGVIVRFLPQAG